MWYPFGLFLYDYMAIWLLTSYEETYGSPACHPGVCQQPDAFVTRNVEGNVGVVRRLTPHVMCDAPGPAALIVDDDTGIRELIADVLESEGYAVELAADGLRALERLRANTRRMVVLLDIMMPGLDGVQVLETVAADDILARRHGFVVMTASSPYANDALMRLAHLFRAPVLTKPFSIETLLSSMSAVAARLRD